jgi:adenine phosphoribosyltransferase
MDLTHYVRNIPDFPKPGIIFRDITPLLGTAEALQFALDTLTEQFESSAIDYVAAIEARGFLFGVTLADRLNAGFVPIRKPGKLPGPSYRQNYALEYGSDGLEIHQDAFGDSGQKRVLLIDDVLATGGTASAAAALLAKAGGQLAGYGFVIELLALEGREQLPEAPVFSLITYS